MRGQAAGVHRDAVAVAPVCPPSKFIRRVTSVAFGGLTAVAGDADLLPGSVHLAMSTATVPIQKISDGAPVVGETPPPINTIARLT